MNKIAVFCGAKEGTRLEYANGVKQLAEAFVSNNIALIYGGAKVGLMGMLANHMLALGGNVIGIIPETLMQKELAHHHLTQLHIVSSLSERKRLTMELADGFIMLPGGAGSLDEFFEAMTLAQLGFHIKPCGVLNIANYFDSLLNFFKHSVSEGFLENIYHEMLIIENNPEKLLQRFANYEAPKTFRWTKNEA